MNVRNKIVAGVAVVAALVSCGAMAAVNADEIHLALTELKLGLVKMAVANAMLANPTPPASNAALHVGAPNKLGSGEFSAIEVSQGGVINLYLTPAVGVKGGILQLVPKIVTDKQGKKAVQFSCYSPNIPDIASADAHCTYRAARK
ncbi:MAG TPA: hypothetical protein VF292_00780 [Rhodanobacteraceae bacterium]